MAKFTFKKTPSGTIEVFDKGKRISTTTVEQATKRFGFTGSALPSEQAVARTATTNVQTGEPSRLVNFKNTADEVIRLAREKRNTLTTGFMGQFRGTTAASDFGSILGNINKATDTFAQDVLERSVSKSDRGDLTSEVIGGFEVLRDSSGEIISTHAVKSEDGPGVDRGTENEREVNAVSNFGSVFVPGATLSDGTQIIGVDGFIDPRAWKEAIADAPAEGLSRRRFIEAFGYLINVPTNKKKLEEVKAKYGLTSIELKIITGEL